VLHCSISASRGNFVLTIQLIKSLLPALVAQTFGSPLGETGHRARAASPHNPAATAETGSALPSLMELPTLAADNLGDLHQSLANLVRGVIQTNLRISQDMLRVTNPDELVALQQRFIRDYLAALMCGSLQLVGAMQPPTAGQTPPRS
jgi:hypothetical protein